MSNCHSSQGEYDDHDFKGGICADCGEVDKPAMKALSAQVSMLERKVTELTERNRRLANQIRGYSDRVNDSLSQVIKNAKQEALREAVRALNEVVEDAAAHGITNGLAWQTGALAMRDQLKIRADKLVTE